MTLSPQKGGADIGRNRRFMVWFLKRWKKIAGVAALVIFFLANRGFRLLTRNWLELRKLKAQETSLSDNLQKQKIELENLSNNPSVLERRARQELDFIKKGETEYRFTPPKAP